MTIENEVRQAVGLPIVPFKLHDCDGYWCEMVIHSDKSGIFDEIEINTEIREKYVKMIDMAVKKGDEIKTFTGASMSLGDIFLRFDTREELDKVMRKDHEWLKIKLLDNFMD